MMRESTPSEADPKFTEPLFQGLPLLSPFFSPCPPLLLGGGFGVTTTTGGFSLGGGGGLSRCPSAKTLTDTMQSTMAVINIRFKSFMISCGLLMPVSHERAWEGEETRQSQKGAISMPQANPCSPPAFTANNLSILAVKRTLSDASRTVSCTSFDARKSRRAVFSGAQ
ncbi:MAG TPA: hypothetical protein VF553_20350 [Pyrinomonadaceae bacterium]|jgi:hypothetical protein